MNKYLVVKMLKNNGDSIISIKGDQPICGTIDFSTPYIKAKRRSAIINTKKDTVLLWSWTDDAYRELSIKDIKRIEPLSELLGNVKNG